MGENRNEVIHNDEHEKHHHHHDNEGETPDAKLVALLKYMAVHNTDHTNELEHLALQVKETGNTTAYELTMEAIRFYADGNAALQKALDYLEV